MRGPLLLLAALAGVLSTAAGTPSAQAWRTFTAADGLARTACLNVTPAPNGDILVRHSDSDVVSVFDGYSFINIPGPQGERARVYESPSGQLWTPTPTGLREFRGGEWPLIAVARLAEFHSKSPNAEILLLPVRQGRVLALLPDELLQISVEDTNNSRVEVITRADALAIGGFTNFLAARNGALLLAGTSGFARSQRPFRALTPNPGWDVLSTIPPEFAERAPRLKTLPEGVMPTDQFALPGEVHWVASSAGLSRSSPLLWRPATGTANSTPPPDTERPRLENREPALWRALRELGDWPALFRARNGDLWLGGASGIAWVQNETLQVFTSTNQLGPEQVSGFAELLDGRIVCATPAKVWEFDGQNWLTLRGGFAHVNALCSARNGTLWVAADDGVHRFVRGAWVHNTAADGLPAARVNSICATASGAIIAQSAAGEFEFHPEADSEPPRTFIKPSAIPRVREGSAVRVTFHGRDRWDATTPERLLFSHKLDEREWSPFQEATEVVLADLPVGRHLFLVRSMDRNANIDRQPARLEFSVVLPWYRETRLVLILAGALLVALFFAALAFNRHRQLQHSYADVERQVAERTHELELAQRELLHSQKMNALGTLAAGIAHDFNNILSIIKGSAQIIEDNPDNPEKIQTRLDRIKTVVQQGAGIVEAMLGFSRQSPGEALACDVNDIVKATLKLLGDRFLRGVEVQFEPAAGLPPLPVARDFVQQVLLNFIFNAAEAMERRTKNRPDPVLRNQILLRTELQHTLPAGLFLKPGTAAAFILISVADNGEGITPENLPRIFEPFFTTKALSSQRGTGLGLSMVYELARKLEAGLAVATEPGRGSTFTLILPLKPS